MKHAGAVAAALLALVLVGCDIGGDKSPEVVRAGGWELRVATVRFTATLSGSEGRQFAARGGERFLVVTARFRNTTPGQEREISSRHGELVFANGDVASADGGGEADVCLECTLTVSTGEAETSMKFVFIVRDEIVEPVSFRYARSAAIELDIPAGVDRLAEEDASGDTRAAWTKIEPGGRTRCARGAPYAFWFHEGASDKLLVFFQPGGGCFDVRSCARESGLFDDAVTEEDDPAVTAGGILDTAEPENPFRDYSILFVPSCTGDVFWGDNVATYRGGGRSVTIEHRGFVNASAALEWAYGRVPNPSEVFVTGCSAGSVGSAVFAPFLIRRYDDARVTQLGDSLAFVFHRPVDLQDDYRAHDNFPRFVPELDRIKPGDFTMTRYYATIARRFPTNVFAQFNFSSDAVQRMFYEAVGGRGEKFPDALRRSLAEIRRRAPNFRCYTAEGESHCILDRRDFYTHVTDGVRLRDWVAALAAGRDVADVGTGAR